MFNQPKLVLHFKQKQISPLPLPSQPAVGYLVKIDNEILSKNYEEDLTFDTVQIVNTLVRNAPMASS